MRTNQTIAFDIDECLITKVGLDDVPRDEVIALYRAFQDLGFTMVVWSGGGVDYAQRWAERLDLKPDRIQAKDKTAVDFAVDDVYGADLGLEGTIWVGYDERSRFSD